MKPPISLMSYVRRGCLLYMLTLSLILCVNQSAYANDDAGSSPPDYAYIALEPDIVTNYVNDNSRRLGFVRVTVEIMLETPSNIPVIEHHMPLLRAIVIEVIGAQNEQRVRSVSGREEVRREILQRFKDVLLRETGDETVRDVIFTRFLRQGG